MVGGGENLNNPNPPDNNHEQSRQKPADPLAQSHPPDSSFLLAGKLGPGRIGPTCSALVDIQNVFILMSIHFQQLNLEPRSIWIEDKENLILHMI